MEKKLGVILCLKCFFFPKNNHWMRRTFLVFAFIFFDYFVTLFLCQTPYQEGNLYARVFMKNFGIPLGLTLFVLIVNLPIYMTLSLDSHIVRFPLKIAILAETFVDVTFAWFIAGLHFSGATSWFWSTSDLTRQSLGALLYMVLTFLVVNSWSSIRTIDHS